MTDKRTIIGLVLVFFIFLGYTWWASPSKEERERISQQQDSIKSSQLYTEDSLQRVKQSAIQDSLSEEELLKSGNDSIVQSIQAKKMGELSFFSNSFGKEEQKYTIETELYKLVFSSKGGRLISASLKDYSDYQKKDVQLISPDYYRYNLAFFTSDNHLVNTENLGFVLTNGENLESKNITGKDSLILHFRAFANEAGNQQKPDTNRYVEFQYIIYGNTYHIRQEIKMEGLKEIVQASSKFLDLNFDNELNRQEKNQKNERMLTSVYYKATGEQVENLADGKDGQKNIRTSLQWISYKQQFFSYSLIPDTAFENAEIEISSQPTEKNAEKHLCYMRSLIGIPYTHGDNYSYSMLMYLGPNKYNILKDYKIDLERQIPLGWGFFLLQWINRFAVIPVFNFLEAFNWNYGLIILVLTLLLKIVLYPISMKSYKSSAIMKIIQPEIEEINKKYPKKDQAMEKSKATMALYKKAGANPMTGCIPMILQFPILIAMFRFFPASIELRHQRFLWADDLSSYDSILDLPFTIPFYGAHISLFCLLMAGVNIFYTRMNMSQSPQSNSLPGMKTMMMLMPIMFLFILNSYSSGLNYYYFLSTCISFIQIWLVKRTIKEESIRQKIRLADLKPIKKSRFMQKLEDMQKMNEQVSKQRGQINKKR